MINHVVAVPRRPWYQRQYDPDYDVTLLTGCAKISILVMITSLDFERATTQNEIVREILKHTMTGTC